jgi:hypothetical protein
MAHGPQIVQLHQPAQLARHLAGNDVHEVHMRVKSRKNLGGVLGSSHRAYLLGAGTRLSTGKDGHGCLACSERVR